MDASAVIPYTFTGIFSLIAGILLGRAARGLLFVPRQVGEAVSILVLAAVFLIISTVVGVSLVGPVYLAVQAVLIPAAAAATALIIPRLRWTPPSFPIAPIVVGGILIIAGMGLGGFLLQDGDILEAVILGGGLTGGGGVMFARGLKKIPRK